MQSVFIFICCSLLSKALSQVCSFVCHWSCQIDRSMNPVIDLWQFHLRLFEMSLKNSLCRPLLINLKGIALLSWRWRWPILFQANKNTYFYLQYMTQVRNYFINNMYIYICLSTYRKYAYTHMDIYNFYVLFFVLACWPPHFLQLLFFQ